MSDFEGEGDERYVVTQLDPQTGKRRPVRVPLPGSFLAWSEGYGDLWISNFDTEALTRVHPSDGAVEVVDRVGVNPAPIVVDGDVVRVGDWARPAVMRMRAVGRAAPRSIVLPTSEDDVSVSRVSAGAGHVWAATPRAGALWRIDPTTDAVTRIAVPPRPSGVAATAQDVWVTVRSSEP